MGSASAIDTALALPQTPHSRFFTTFSAQEWELRSGIGLSPRLSQLPEAWMGCASSAAPLCLGEGEQTALGR